MPFKSILWILVIPVHLALTRHSEYSSKPSATNRLAHRPGLILRSELTGCNRLANTTLPATTWLHTEVPQAVLAASPTLANLPAHKQVLIYLIIKSLGLLSQLEIFGILVPIIAKFKAQQNNLMAWNFCLSERWNSLIVLIIYRLWSIWMLRKMHSVLQ